MKSKKSNKSLELQPPEHIQKVLLGLPYFVDKLSKLKAKIKTKKGPTTILSEYAEKHLKHYNGAMKSDFNAIIIKSKTWRVVWIK